MKNMADNFILIGLMGAGKTTLGRQLSEHYQRPFYDSDQVLCERTGVNIPTIFEMEGEEGFRNRESGIIRDLCSLRNIIIATGGGAVLREENRQQLQKNGLVIYLHARPETLYARTQNDKNRPLLQVDNPLQRLKDLYTTRDVIYRQTADIVFDSEHSNSQQSLAKLLTILSDYQTS